MVVTLTCLLIDIDIVVVHGSSLDFRLVLDLVLDLDLVDVFNLVLVLDRYISEKFKVFLQC